MAKTTLQAIATAVAERYGLKGNEATAFVAAFFEQIQKGLEQDKLVKVRGLGTFKVQAVKSRESVNVNTGERVVISGHEKMAFTPDIAMKELVNRPFADFETVVLKDGVDVDSVPTPKEEEAVEPKEQEDKIENKNAEAATSPANPMQRGDELPHEAVQPACGEGLQTSDVAQHQGQNIVQPSSEHEDVSIDSVERQVEERVAIPPRQDTKSPRKLTPSERFSQLMDDDVDTTPAKNEPESAQGHESLDSGKGNALAESDKPSDNKQIVSPEESETLIHKAGKDSVKDSSESGRESDNSAVNTLTESKVKSHKVCTTLLVVLSVLVLVGLGVAGYFYFTTQQTPEQQSAPVRANQKKQSAPKPVSEGDTLSKAAHAAPQKNIDATGSHVGKDADVQNRVVSDGIDLEEANRYPALRFGAYHIVGVEKKVVLRKGETMEKLCRRTLGKDMMGYFEAINGKKHYTAGDTILVPKVELRPEYRK